MHRIIARLKVELIVLGGYAMGILILAGLFMDREYYTQDTVLWQLKILIETTIPDLYIRITLALVLLLCLFFLVKKAFAIGGPGAIIAVIMGFLAGLATPTDITVGLVMLGLGLVCGYVSVTGLKTLKLLRARGPGV